MYKQKENEHFVWYKFKQNVYTGEYIDKKGRKLNKLENKIGLFKFDKTIADPCEEAIEIIKDQTDKYFWDNKRTLIKCLIKIRQCKKEGFYPNVVEYASG